MGPGRKSSTRPRLGKHNTKKSQNMQRIWKERKKNQLNQGMSKSGEPHIDPVAEDSRPSVASHSKRKARGRYIGPGAENSRPSVASHSKLKTYGRNIDPGAEDSSPGIVGMSPMADGNDTHDIREAEHESEIASVLTPDKAIKPLISLKGRRIVELSKFQATLKLTENHARSCSTSNLNIVHERRDGLISIFKLNCSGCKRTFRINSDTRVRKQTVNAAVVKGATAAGITPTQLQELFAHLDIV